jgi:hypothetical protein
LTTAAVDGEESLRGLVHGEGECLGGPDAVTMEFVRDADVDGVDAG